MGGMVTAIERAKSAGFAVAVLNPNTNSVSWAFTIVIFDTGAT